MSKVRKQNEYYNGSCAYKLETIADEQTEIVVEDYKDTDEKRENAEELERRLIEQAQHEAEGIINRAQEEAEAVKAEAERDGYAAGVELGKKEGLDTVGEMISEAQSILTQMHDEKYNMLSDMEDEILKLSICIAEKIICKKLNEDETAYLSMISAALKKASDADGINIYVSSEQYEKISDLKAELSKSVKGIKSFDIIKKEFEDKFDCFIETDCGQIEAGAKAQIRQVEKSFRLSQSYA